jgi:hypothetical protein
MQLHAPTPFKLAKPNPSCNCSVSRPRRFHNRLAALEKQSFSGRADRIAIVEPTMGEVAMLELERQAAAVRARFGLPYNALHECGVHPVAHNAAAVAAAAVAA